MFQFNDKFQFKDKLQFNKDSLNRLDRLQVKVSNNKDSNNSNSNKDSNNSNKDMHSNNKDMIRSLLLRMPCVISQLWLALTLFQI